MDNAAELATEDTQDDSILPTDVENTDNLNEEEKLVREQENMDKNFDKLMTDIGKFGKW